METTTTPAVAERQVWTPERMYDSTWAGNKFGHYRLTPEFRAACAKETAWEQVEQIPRLSKEEQRAVGLGEMVCNLCQGDNRVYVLHRGQDTGIERTFDVPCHCLHVRSFWGNFRHTDSRCYDAHLATMKPTEKVSTSLERQAEIHQKLRARPNGNVLLTGPSGGGKTFLAAALFRQAVSKSTLEQEAANNLWTSVWWTATSVLLNQHATWEIVSDKEGVTDPRYVTEAMIQTAADRGRKPRLFLDELDKFAVTSSGFKPNRLYELVNAVYKHNGQIVATMNKSVEDFGLMLRDRDLAESIIRRIGGDGGQVIYVG